MAVGVHKLVPTGYTLRNRKMNAMWMHSTLASFSFNPFETPVHGIGMFPFQMDLSSPTELH